MNRSTWLKIHRTIGIIIVIQLIASFTSALIFAIRSTLHHVKPESAEPRPAQTPPAYDLAEAIKKSALDHPVSAKLWHAGSHPIYEITSSDVGVVLDGLTGRRLNPSDEIEIRRITALALNRSQDQIPSPERISAHNATHTRGELPIWRFRTSDGAHHYVSMKTGRIVTSADRMARISQFAYHYLHTMKYTDSDLLNAFIPIPYILAGLGVGVLGIYLFLTRNIRP